MQRHRLAHNQRLQDVRLKLLHQQHNADHNERLHRSQGHQRQKNRHRPREQSTNHGDERPQEHEHTQWYGQRHAQDCGTNADTYRINSGHKNLHPHIRAQGLPPSAPCTVNSVACPPREKSHNKQPDAFALHEEEHEGEQGDKSSGRHFGGGAAYFRDPADNGAGVLGG